MEYSKTGHLTTFSPIPDGSSAHIKTERYVRKVPYIRDIVSQFVLPNDSDGFILLILLAGFLNNRNYWLVGGHATLQ